MRHMGLAGALRADTGTVDCSDAGGGAWGCQDQGARHHQLVAAGLRGQLRTQEAIT
jgi:hypothetical protein